MFGSLIKGLLAFLLGYTLATGMKDKDPGTESELQQKVQEHMDVIVDESAAIVDDVMEEARKDECVQEAEAFVNDVNEIVDNTVEDIHAHFGTKEETEDLTEAQTEG